MYLQAMENWGKSFLQAKHAHVRCILVATHRNYLMSVIWEALSCDIISRCLLDMRACILNF